MTQLAIMHLTSRHGPHSLPTLAAAHCSLASLHYRIDKKGVGGGVKLQGSCNITS